MGARHPSEKVSVVRINGANVREINFQVKERI